MALVIVRHGRTEANAAGLLLGRADPPLDDLGRRQAAALARCVGEVARVISSPLTRARQTADAFAAPITVDERWIELDYGALDGTPVAEVPAELWRRWRADVRYSPAGGESLSALGRRVRAACEELAAEAVEGDTAAGDIVVVTHVSPVKASVAWALGVEDSIAWRMHVDAASLTRIEIRATSPVLRAFNDVAHLGELG